ncbi:hypothetical protein OO010_02590 [Flavobacteriaceae bacterium KMM 6898]|nr:hypothetical protein [Flavobacteriaceae bacterium KMM 6898]
MRKILAVSFVFSAIVAMSSCNYDDSNDIDVLNPNDSIKGSSYETKMPQ